MKRKIRLTEGDLRRIVRQCVNESIGKFRPTSAERYWKFDSVGGYHPYPRPKDKDGQMRSDWEDIDITYPYGRSDIDHLEADADQKEGNGIFKGMNDNWTPEDIEGTTEDEWYGYEPEWSHNADSRPLHRKGSLNRAMDESTLHRIIKKNVGKVLKEAYYHDKGYPRFFC